MKIFKRIKRNNTNQYEGESVVSLSNAIIDGSCSDKILGNLSEGTFIKCVYKNLNLNGYILDKCVFKDCIFENCNFENCNTKIGMNLKFFKCKFKNVDIKECNLGYIYIEESILINVKFKDAFLGGATFIGNSYEYVTFEENCNLMNAVIKDNYKAFDIKFINEKSYTKLNYGTYIGRFNYKKLISREVNFQDVKLMNLNISNTYMDLGAQFLRNNVSGKYGVCFHESKRAYHRTLEGVRKIISRIYDVVCGYGEKPSRTFLISLLLVVLFGVLYMFTGLKTFSNEVISLSTLGNILSREEFLKLFIYSVYFSTVTFATVGYGDIMVVNAAGMVISIIEIIIGVFMIGVWTSTLVRKMTR